MLHIRIKNLLSLLLRRGVRTILHQIYLLRHYRNRVVSFSSTAIHNGRAAISPISLTRHSVLSFIASMAAADPISATAANIDGKINDGSLFLRRRHWLVAVAWR